MMPEAPAWARPRVTPAPSPTAKKPGRAVSSWLDSWMRAEVKFYSAPKSRVS